MICRLPSKPSKLLKKQSEAMKKAFDIIRKKYHAGQSSLIEFLDARTP